MSQPLAGIMVVELATGVSGPYTGRMFADYGAEVIKVEPADGDPTRREGARPGPRPDPESSPLFAHLNTNKRSVVLPEGDDGDRLLEDLLARADLVIESSRPDDETEAQLRPAALRARHPHLVVASVTPFGQTGPAADRSGGDLIAYAAGGPLHATGNPDREPIKLAGRVVEYQCGATAAAAALGALFHRARSGHGSHVDVANFETQAASIDRRMALLMHYRFTGELGQRQGGNRIGIIPAGVYPTADGYCQIVFAPNWMDRVSKMLDHAELSEHLAQPGWMDDPQLPELMAEAVFAWTVQRGKREAMVEAQAQSLAVMPLNDTRDVLEDPHFRARDYWATVDHPSLGRYEAPGPHFRMADAWRIRRPAPQLGQHSAEVLAETTSTATPAETAAGSADRLPLEGVRVLDMTVVWAGPLATTLLGDLGAEVVRVDNPNLFPTATRGAIPRPRAGRERDLGQYWGAYAEDDAGERPWNRVGSFLIHARGKKSVTLDARTELGRETFLRLVEQCDVFVENNSVKVLEQLGLTWEVLRERNPRLIVLRMPSLGLRGPHHTYIGFGAHMEALCGLTSLRGYLDLDPSSLDATYFMDPASGVAGAFAAMCALRRRQTTGTGELIELAQAENLLHYIGEYLIDTSISGDPHERHGNRHPHRAPQGVYPTAGTDRWVAVSVADDAQWASLVDAMGRPAWALDPELSTEEGRRTRHDELDAELAEWTSGQDRFELASQLRAVGIEASAVLDEADLIDDPQLAHRGFWRTNSSSDVPETLFPGHLWRWDGPELSWGELNVMGRDNDEILRGVVGLDDDEMEALAAEGHLTDGYRDAAGNPV